MTRGMLIYHWDHKAGRMRLRGAHLRLRYRDRALLEAALVRQYESLIAELERGGTEPTILFDATVARPRRIRGFRVRWGGDSRARCPELTLEPLRVSNPKAGRAEKSPRRSPARKQRAVTVDGTLTVRPSAASRELAIEGNAPWVTQFMMDIKQRLSIPVRVRLSTADQAGMAFALTQLQKLCSHRPEDLAVVLLAGYVSLGERTADSTKPEEASLYRLAARVLDQWCAATTRATADESPISNGAQPKETVGQLRRITRFLGRILGLQDEEDWM